MGINERYTKIMSEKLLNSFGLISEITFSGSIYDHISYRVFVYRKPFESLAGQADLGLVKTARNLDELFRQGRWIPA